MGVRAILVAAGIGGVMIGIVIGVLLGSGDDDDVEDVDTSTTTVPATTTASDGPRDSLQPSTSTTEAPTTTERPPVTVPSGECTVTSIAADLGRPIADIGPAECHDGFALASVCAGSGLECTDSTSLLRITDGRWTLVGGPLQTCIEALVAMAVPDDTAAKFRGYSYCSTSVGLAVCPTGFVAFGGTTEGFDVVVCDAPGNMLWYVGVSHENRISEPRDACQIEPGLFVAVGSPDVTVRYQVDGRTGRAGSTLLYVYDGGGDEVLRHVFESVTSNSGSGRACTAAELDHPALEG
jgi:hypothetical protein